MVRFQLEKIIPNSTPVFNLIAAVSFWEIDKTLDFWYDYRIESLSMGILIFFGGFAGLVMVYGFFQSDFSVRILPAVAAGVLPVRPAQSGDCPHMLQNLCR